MISSNLQPSILDNVFSLGGWCTDGLQIAHSPTRCGGTVSQSCEFVCDDGYIKTGDHVCGVDGVFRGGTCVASTCAAPVIAFPRVIVSGCVGGGVLDQNDCELGCSPGYIASQMAVGVCSAVVESPSSAYQGHYIRCTPFSVSTATGAWYFASDTSRDAYGLYADAGEASSTIRPGSRVQHAAAHVGSSLFVFGGEGFERSGPRLLSSEMWRTDDDTIWAYMGGGTTDTDHTIITWPQARKGHCLHNLDGVLLLFAGQIDSDSFAVASDVWEWSTGTWSLVGSSGTSWPAARTAFASWAILDSTAADSLWTFGGVGDNSGVLNDMWQYQSGAWTSHGGVRDPLPVYGTMGQAAGTSWPGGRWGAASWTGDNGMVLFGGEGTDSNGLTGHLSDLWRHNELMWCWIGGPMDADQPSSFEHVGIEWPGGRSLASSWVDVGAAFVFGGEYDCAESASGKCFSDDLWRFDSADERFTWAAGSQAANSFGAYTIQRTADESNWISSRSGAAVWKGDNGLLLFGGEGYVTTGGDAGVLMDLWHLPPWCKTDTVDNSTTRCSGTVGAACNFACNDGHAPNGTHVCGTSGYFSGGFCVPSTCDAPLLLRSQKVTFGCGNGSSHGTACHLACADNHWATNDSVLGVCAPDSGSSTSSYKFQEAFCEPVRSCSSLEFETASPTAMSDRECANLTVCNRDEYELIPPTATSNRTCSALRVCTAFEFESVAPTGTSNRECTVLRECAPNEYESHAPTATSDRVCATITSCETGQWQVSDSTLITDAICQNITECDIASQFEEHAPTNVTDRVCKGVKSCTTAEFEFAPPTAFTDRVCESLTVCDAIMEYEVLAADYRRDRICATIRQCTNDEYEAAAKTATTDRSCARLTVCAAEEYESLSPTTRNDRECRPATTCGPDQYESQPLTALTDRTCTYLRVCNTVAQAVSGEFEEMQPTLTTDRICQNLTVCNSDTEFESVPPTVTSDRVCVPATVCSPLEWQSTPVTTISDRACTTVTLCNFPSTYEFRAPSETSDRICADVIGCKEVLEWQRTDATPTSQRICGPVTVCGGSTYEMVPSTATADAICQENVAAQQGSSIANLTFAMDFSEVDAMGVTVFADMLVRDLVSLLQIDRTRLVVSRLLPGSIIAEVLFQPQDGKILSVELIQRLQTMHANPDSQMYDQARFPLLSRIDPTRTISFQGMREGIPQTTVFYFLIGGGVLFSLGLCLLAHARSVIKPGRRYTDDEGPGSPESLRTLFLVLGLASFVAHLLFCFVVLSEEPEFAFERDQFVALTFYTRATLFGMGPLSVVLTVTILTRQKKRLLGAAEIDEFNRVRAAVIVTFALFQPELLQFLPWHETQRTIVTIVMGLHAVVECVLHLLLQMDYSARRGGFDLAKTSGVLAAAAMAVTVLSLLARVLGRYATRLYGNYAARVRKLRTKMKVVPQRKAQRPNTMPAIADLDEPGALNESNRKFLPTAIMCGLESELMLANDRRKGLQISRGTVQSGVMLEKQWTLRNLGKVAWPKRARLVCIGGDEPGLEILTHEDDLEIPGWVGPGSKVELKVQLQAPSNPGPYVLYFQLQDQAGRLFGQRIWAQATVRAAGIDASTMIDYVRHDDVGRLAGLVDADRKRKGSADAMHAQRRADTRPISHPAVFSLGLYEQADLWKKRLEDPEYKDERKAELPALRLPGATSAAKRIAY